MICPHANSAHMEDEIDLPNEAFLQGDLEILARCDAIVMTPDWAKSHGAIEEKAFAEARGIPVYVWPDMPKQSVTERFRPKQSAAFLDTVMKMYRTHLSKNADYSPANILGTGEIGLVTRLWDKVARLMNLSGFHFDVVNQQFDKPAKPKNESIEDTLQDAAVYSVIGLLLRQGVWGK